MGLWEQRVGGARRLMREQLLTAEPAASPACRFPAPNSGECPQKKGPRRKWSIFLESECISAAVIEQEGTA